MTNFSFNQTVKQAEKEYGLGAGEYFKVKDGDNRIRILSQAVAHQSDYKGKKSVKFVAWVIDRRDGNVKPYFMPVTITRTLASFQDDPDWAFESVPMPYDINIKASNAGTTEVKYDVVPSPKQTAISSEEFAALEDKLPIEEFVKKLAEKENQNTPQSEPVESNEQLEINVEDIPF